VVLVFFVCIFGVQINSLKIMAGDDVYSKAALLEARKKKDPLVARLKVLCFSPPSCPMMGR
jgi:hypothetical protein